MNSSYQIFGSTSRVKLLVAVAGENRDILAAFAQLAEVVGLILVEVDEKESRRKVVRP